MHNDHRRKKETPTETAGISYAQTLLRHVRSWLKPDKTRLAKNVCFVDESGLIGGIPHTPNVSRILAEFVDEI